MRIFIIFSIFSSAKNIISVLSTPYGWLDQLLELHVLNDQCLKQTECLNDRKAKREFNPSQTHFASLVDSSKHITTCHSQHFLSVPQWKFLSSGIQVQNPHLNGPYGHQH